MPPVTSDTATIVAPADAKYIIQIRESSYTGNGNCRYRLHVGAFPRPTAVYPAGGQVGTEVEVKLIGDPAGESARKLKLPEAAKSEILRDRSGLTLEDPGIDLVVEEGVEWLVRAQNHSSSQDSGVASHFSLLTGWSPSYPETTGHIVPTMLEYARLRGDETVRQRARRMLHWLVSIQFPDGSFSGGVVGSRVVVPTNF